jgi:glycerol-3-phosphate acyltransferase PlsY
MEATSTFFISIELIILCIISYFIGAIPTGVIISKRFFGFDIRTKGSGNMGSTNVSRVLGTRWGILVQVLDILKGVVPVLLLGGLIGSYWLDMCNESSFLSEPILKLIIGIAAVIGHIWSCFVNFKGGKGINVALGMLIAIMPIEILFALLFFIIVVGISGFVSLGSMLAAIMVPVIMFIRRNIFNVDITSYLTLVYIMIGFAVLICFVHRSNIKRLFQRKENRMDKMRFIYKLVKKHS